MSRALWRRLDALDPVAAGRIDPANRRRIVRALEVTLGAGRPFSSFGPGLRAYPPTDVVMIGLRWRARGAGGTHRAARAGHGRRRAAAEVERLAAAGPLSRTARQALGYKELLDEPDLDAAVKATIVAGTRQFAVRQERWFRRDPRVRWIDVEHDPVAEAAPALVDALRSPPMTVLTLTKHHGLGNDFLVAFEPAVDDLPALARRLCDRRRGIGADGLLVGTDDRPNAAAMVLYNADGSRAEMSGNGVRCFAQAWRRRHGDGGPLRITTDAGLRIVEIAATEDPATIVASVDMGEVRPIDAPPGWAVGRRAAGPSGRPSRRRATRTRWSPSRTSRPSTWSRSGADCRPSTSRSSSRAPSRTPSRCACTSEAPASPTPVARVPSPPRGQRPAGRLVRGEELLVHMDGGSARVALHVPTSGHATLTGPATYVARIEISVP